MSRKTILPDRLENALLTINQLSKTLINNEALRGSTAYELAVLHEVIDRRYQLVRPSVLISNLPASSKPKFDADGKQLPPSPSLEQYIGARALDRLRENGALLAGFSWDSARGRT